MPSVHVAMTTWAAIAVSAAWPRLRVLMWSFAAAIFVGSFALGWHYVSDGLAGALGAMACWKLAGIYLAYGAAPKRRLAATAVEAGM